MIIYIYNIYVKILIKQKYLFLREKLFIFIGFKAFKIGETLAEQCFLQSIRER